jgi:acyl carrier protein
VEAALEQLAGVSRAAVVTQGQEAGSKQLVAFVVPAPEGAGLSPEPLRKRAVQALPKPMVPTQFILVETLPLSPNGKVDRRTLAAIRPTPPTDSSPVSRPLNAAEEQIARVWKEVFAREQVGLDDNFFDLGGHSLLATRVVSRLNQTLSASVSVTTLFDYPTIRALAEQLSVVRQPPMPGPIPKRTPARLPTEIRDRIDTMSEAEIDALLKQASA